MINFKEKLLINKVDQRKIVRNIFFTIINEHLVWVLLLFTFIFTSIFMPNFLRLLNLFSIIKNGVPLGFLALSAALVLIVGHFDISIESTLGFTALIGGILVVNSNVNSYFAIIIMLSLGAVIGFFNGICVVKLGVPSLMQTLSMMILLRGAILLIAKGITVAPLPNNYRFLGNAEIFKIPSQVIVLIVVYLFFTILLSRTALGRRIYAVGANRELAFLSGIKIDNIQILAFTISGFLAAMAGLILSGKNGAVDRMMGSGMVFNTLAAVVLGGVILTGGKGRVFGALGGVLFLSTMTSALSWFEVNTFAIQTVSGFIVLAAIIIDAIKSKFFIRQLSV